MALERILWIELIGFDNRDSDMGVAALLEKAGFVPRIASLLIWSNDFVHSHRSDEGDDTLLREDCCSYYGRPCSEEHGRQAWTKGQLKRLIAELQARNIAVFFAVFDQLMDQSVIELFQLDQIRPQWMDAHPELLYVNRTGVCPSYLCPWKHLADGTLYEDFFAAQLRAVLLDYGFDGYHGADGYCRGRFAICDGDFSNDMIGQFLAWRGGNGKSALLARNSNERGELIWNTQRAQWIAFHQWRHRQFWQKIADLLHGMARRLIVNSVWTRDPFEAAFRYGVDMRTFAEIGVDGMIIEAGASVIELEQWGDPDADTLYKYMAAILRVRAELPEIKLWVLNSVKDTLEQYNLIRHAPSLLESDIVGFGTLRCYGAGQWGPAIDGVVPCLSDGLKPHEWAWLNQAWEVSEVDDGTPVGVTVIWSQAAVRAELAAYCREPFCSSYRWHFHLLAAGAPVFGMADIAELERLSGPVLVLNPEFFPAAERRKLRRYRGGECFELGRGAEGILACFEEMQPPLRDNWPSSWTQELPEPQPGRLGMESAVRLLFDACRAPRVAHGSAQVWTTRLPDGRWRLVVRSNAAGYQSVKIAVPGEVDRIVPRTEYCIPIYHKFQEESNIDELVIKLPPKGVVVVELTRVQTNF